MSFLSGITPQKLLEVLIGMGLFILSGSIHEFAHAYSAYKLGDNTAKGKGRLTLNPLHHIDIFGSILFPLIGAFSGLPVFGWMRPVPVNPNNFRNPSKGQAIVSFAGPFSNLLLASFGIIIFKVVIGILISIGVSSFILNGTVFVLANFIFINITLMIFNLLPVPPLDGGWIVRYFLPYNLKSQFDKVYRYGFIILYVLLLLGFFRAILNPIIILMASILSNIRNINIFILGIPFIAILSLLLVFLKDDVVHFLNRLKKR